jgi:DNA-binding transcriptional ArsR family regulator
MAKTMVVRADVTVAAGRLFKVLADPTRLALLRRLAEGEASVGELVAALGNPPQSRVSNHLACLRWCELVTGEKVGRSVVYRLVDHRVLALIDVACDVAAPHADHLASCTRIGPEWI